MPTEPSSTIYHTYLLRLRHRAITSQDDSMPDAAQWQLILIHPYTGAHRTFDTLDALIIFLQEQMAAG
jgi:hypothetical protein